MFVKFGVACAQPLNIALGLVRQERVFGVVDLAHKAVVRRLDNEVLPDVIRDKLGIEQDNR